ncbi:MAG: hypothetical protein JKY60_11155 [Kordiimonadaceae bacterium]|nr:hypothetical protein [Kordiimonadaceae bacterium]
MRTKTRIFARKFAEELTPREAEEVSGGCFSSGDVFCPGTPETQCGGDKADDDCEA